MTPESLEAKLHQQKLENFLLKKGWRKAANGWRHPNLVTNWSLADATQLQKEADDGRQEPVLSRVRGETWPP